MKKVILAIHMVEFAQRPIVVLNEVFDRSEEEIFEFNLPKLEDIIVPYFEEDEKPTYFVPKAIKRKNPIRQFNRKKLITHRRK